MANRLARNGTVPPAGSPSPGVPGRPWRMSPCVRAVLQRVRHRCSSVEQGPACEAGGPPPARPLRQGRSPDREPRGLGPTVAARDRGGSTPECPLIAPCSALDALLLSVAARTSATGLSARIRSSRRSPVARAAVWPSRAARREIALPGGTTLQGDDGRTDGRIMVGALSRACASSRPRSSRRSPASVQRSRSARRGSRVQRRLTAFGRVERSRRFRERRCRPREPPMNPAATRHATSARPGGSPGCYPE